MKDELKKLFEGVDGLKPEFLNRIQAVVESKAEEVRIQAIRETEERCESERVALVETHAQQMQELKESFLPTAYEKLDSFLNAAVLEWANENAPAIDSNLKVEMAEKFLTGVTNLFAEANIQVVADKEGVVAELQEKVQAESSRAAMAEQELNSLRESINNEKRETIITKVCEGLADTQISQVKDLVEGVAMADEVTFSNRVKRYRDLVEGKKEPISDKKSEPSKEKDGKDPMDVDDKKKDEANGEVNESVAAQIRAALSLRG